MDAKKLIGFLILGFIILFCFAFISTIFNLVISIIHLVAMFFIGLLKLLLSKEIIGLALFVGLILWFARGRSRSHKCY